MQFLWRIFKAIQDYSHGVPNKFGVTSPPLGALKTISQSESLSLDEVSKSVYLHPNTITGVVDAIKDKGYVARVSDQEDRRVVKV